MSNGSKTGCSTFKLLRFLKLYIHFAGRACLPSIICSWSKHKCRMMASCHERPHRAYRVSTKQWLSKAVRFTHLRFLNRRECPAERRLPPLHRRRHERPAPRRVGPAQDRRPVGRPHRRRSPSSLPHWSRRRTPPSSLFFGITVIIGYCEKSLIVTDLDSTIHTINTSMDCSDICDKNSITAYLDFAHFQQRKQCQNIWYLLYWKLFRW